ncbi:MAG TPA: hypothetical protein PLY52_04065 [Methanothrix sp.]|jgi:hypothetical protein|nr:hypothetical protein [Methanothrix sp.]MDI9418545.1 hypothetical protein [Euryarchaeota archaeon]HON35471.1 hypothetical protein [Methanothrix sp.]HRU74785.1 hypothetical protein [Methanothrix sp.]
MKNKMVYISILLCLAGLAVAAEYTDWQKGAMEGLKKGFEMGQAYQLALDGKDIDGFNAKVDQYNAWVRANFGEDPAMLMNKMDAPIDLSKPVLITNQTVPSKGIVHKIDGSSGKKVSTNDMNMLSDADINRLYKESESGREVGEYLSGRAVGEYLSGV